MLCPGKPELIRLLESASRSHQSQVVSSFSEEQINWAVRNGLGPLLVWATREDRLRDTSPLWPLLQGADLTARVISAEHFDALTEIVDACDFAAPLTLLKGISIADQYYPEPHLRPMRDIDLLVRAESVSTVEFALEKLGYVRRSKSGLPPTFFETYHHSMPFMHPRRNVWVEIHDRLFPPATFLGDSDTFSINRVVNEVHVSEFKKGRVSRLSPELQLAYIASHWTRSFSTPGGVVAMLDMIFLLRGAHRGLDWDRLLHWLDGSVSASHVYLILSYLKQYDLVKIEESIFSKLALTQRSFGKLNLKMLHRVIDRHMLGGKTVDSKRVVELLSVVWGNLLLPSPPWLNLARVLWNLLVPLCVRYQIAKLRI
jgi:Uncharacterised nucleotidyltransferase